MKRVLAILLVLLVILAGCSGVPGMSDDTQPTGGTGETVASSTPVNTSTMTATPVGTELQTVTPAAALVDEELPAGMTASGIDDPTALVEIHRQNLATTGAVTVLAANVSVGGFKTERRSTAMIAGDGTVSVDERVESSFADITTHVYADGDDVYQNQTVQGQSTYSTFSSPYYRTAALPSTTVAQQLVLGTYAVSMVEQTDAGTLVTLTATGTTESTIQDASIENLSGTLVVDLSGTIRSFSTSYEVTAHGQTTAIEIEYTVERRNVEPVEPSAWVETATERSTTADLRYVSEEDVLAIEHAGGDSVAAGTHIVVTEVVAEGAPFGNPESLTAFSASLDDVLSPGETAYIYQPVGLSDAANVTIGERPDEEAAHLPATVLVQVVDVYTNEIVDVTEVTTEDDS